MRKDYEQNLTIIIVNIKYNERSSQLKTFDIALIVTVAPACPIHLPTYKICHICRPSANCGNLWIC
jgi:hypothetical protein